MGLRSLLLLLALGAGFWLFHNWRRRLRSQHHRPPPGEQKMLRCARCGLHVPASEAVQRDGRDYCSADHARQGPADGE